VHKEEEMHADLLVTSCADNDLGYSDPERMHFFWDQLPTSSTTCKILETFKFAHRHVEYRFMARMGDDTYLNVKLFLRQTMQTLPRRRLYFGRMAWPEKHAPISGAAYLYAAN
jgi:hypothetical protein